jgi:hypothetical protein
VVGYDDLMSLPKDQGAEVQHGDFLCLYTCFADLIKSGPVATGRMPPSHVCAPKGRWQMW